MNKDKTHRNSLVISLSFLITVLAHADSGLAGVNAEDISTPLISDEKQLISSPVPLANELTEKLGITSGQAEAGAGSIFKFAQLNMDEDEFQKIAGAVPGMQQLMTAGPLDYPAAPQSPEPESTIATSRMSLKKDFDQLGLAADMVDKFILVIIEYVRRESNETVASLLEKALAGQQQETSPRSRI